MIFKHECQLVFIVSSVTRFWQFFAILAIFRGFGRQFFCPKLLVYKSFDVDILAFKKTCLFTVATNLAIFTIIMVIFLSEHLVTLIVMKKRVSFCRVCLSVCKSVSFIICIILNCAFLRYLYLLFFMLDVFIYYYKPSLLSFFCWFATLG